jgi:hypothetical protein
MHGTRAVRTFHAALIALVGALVMTVGAASAYAGGSDHGNGLGHQKTASDKGQQSDDQWGSDKSDESSSEDTKSDHGKPCNEESSSAGEQTGEQPSPPAGGEQGGEQKGEQGGEQKGEQGKKEEENKGSNKGGETSQGGPALTPETTPAVVTTPAPATVPVQAQQAPASGGEVQGESEQAPEETGQGGGSPSSGGRVLAENQTTTPTASESGLAGTGFDARQLALLGAVCVAGSALLLRRTRKS